MTSVIERALRAELDRRRCGPATDFRIEPFRPGVGGTHPGVDLDDSAALLDVLDGPR